MYLSQNKDKGGLESLPETGQWNSGDKTRIESVEGINNEDPGVNSDDEEDVPQVMLNIRVTAMFNIYIIADGDLFQSRI